MTSLNGVPLPYPGWVEQMTGCAPSVAQALRPYPQYCDNLQGLNENHGDVALQLAAGEAREAVLRQHLRARLLHAVEDDLERIGQHAARRRDLERPAGRHLAVRARPQRSDCRHRYAARAVGGVRLPAAVRRRQAVRQHRRRRRRAGGRLADEHDLPLLVGPAALLPFELLQRARAVPRRLHPGDHQRRRGVRPGQGQLRSGPGTALQRRRRSSRSARSTTTTGGATGWRRRFAASAITTRI